MELKHVLKIGMKEVELTTDEAKELYRELDRVFGKKGSDGIPGPPRRRFSQRLLSGRGIRGKDQPAVWSPDTGNPVAMAVRHLAG